MKKAVNKVILVLLSVVLLLNCAAPSAAFAATAPPEYAVKSAVASVGKTFSTTLVVKNIAGLQSGMAIIEYDKSVLTFDRASSYMVTEGTSGLQQPVSADVMFGNLSESTVYAPQETGKGYISYSFMTQDRALASSDITRVKSTELILATLFFTVKSTAPVGKTTINIVNSSAEVGSRLFTPAVTAGTVTVYSNPITDYTTGGTNSAGQYIDVAPTNDLSAATVISFGKTGTAGISPTAFSTASKVNYLKFTSPVIDNSAGKDPANPTEYPQAAFSNLTTLKSVSINLSKSNLSKSRFFTDDGVMYIRDVDASGNLLDTCKIYLIPYAHAATITLAANVTGFFNADAICNKTQTYTYRHSTHIEGEGVVTKAPTCTAAGVRTYYCIFNPNEAIRTEEIAKLGHKYSTKYTVDTPATCTEDGSESRHCIRCGAKYSGSVRAIPATGHSWGEWKKYTNNYHRRICANDETHTELQKHTWDAGTITTAATCTTDGVKTYKCSVCNGKKTEAIPATGHAWGAWKKLDATQHQRVCATDETHIEKANHTWDAGKVTKAATCTTEGVKTYTCTGCKATKTEPIAIDPANHADYGTDTVNRLDPTCTGTGYTGDKVCRGCGEMLESGQEIPANGHAWKDWTDSGDGANHTRECAVCGEQESAEHVWDAGTVTKTATCKAKGETLYTCTVCGATKKTAIAIDPSNHADYGTEIVNQLDPTCVETGYTGDKVCLGCGQMFEAGQEIPANGHAWKDWTDSGDGANHTRECAVCGEHENAVHVWNDGTVSKEATCAEKGELLYTCTVCGAEKKEAVAIDPDNHADYATHIENAKKATCEKAGYTGDTVCDACGKIVTSGSELAPLGHDWGEWKIVTEPDCVNPGSRVRYCRNSKKHSETEEIPALGHTWQNEEVIRSATCREEGVKRHACAVCGFEEEFAYSDANAHIWEQNGTNIWGTPKWKCSVCGAEEVQRDKPGSSYVEITTEPPVTEPPTEPPTTEAPTTEAPTTEAPTTETPTTETPTTETPITVEPTTEEPTTEEPTTEAPTTEAPTTEAPSTEAPITEAPTTEAPTTEAPTTEAPTTEAPTTEAPTTEAPTTEAPTTEAPATEPTTPGVPSTNLTVPSTGATVPSVPSQTDSGVTEPKVSYQLGDVNMDGKIKSSDARLALRAAAKLEKLSDLQLLLADANEDGKIKAGDARSILRISARLEPQPDKMIAATV